MDIRKNLSVFTHFLALAGYAALSLNGNANIPVFLLYITILFTSLYFDVAGNKYVLRTSYCNILAVALILFLSARIFLFGDEIFFVLISFITYVQLIKFLGKKDISDYEQIILISFFQLLAGAATTTRIVYGVMLFIFVLLSIVTIFLFNIYKEQNQTKDGIKKDRQFRYRALLSSTVLIWTGVIILTLSAFLFMPRFKGNFLSSSLLNKNRLSTGFNTEIELGQVGEIKKDSTPVMRVKFLNKTIDELPETIYWRGVALDYFDGKYWTQTDKNNKSRIAKNYDGLFILDNKNSEELALQEIVAQPIDTDVLFSASTPVAFSDLPFRSLYTVNNSYYHNGNYTNNIRYLAYSDLRVPEINKLNIIDDSIEKVSIKYTQAFDVSEAVSELSSELYSEQNTRFENVKNVEQYLYRNLNYTRVLENTGSSPPLDQFLFEGLQGHCEYFASAMVVLLREMSIPSRLVTGFVGGEYNYYGEYFLIRESDAHAWVEVYFNDYGWVIFDPTPGNDTDLYTGFNLITGTIEYLRYRWNRYVVEFNVNDQRSILKNIGNRSEKLNFNFISKLKTQNTRTYFTIISGILFLLIVYNLLKNRFAFTSNAKRNSIASETYIKSLKLMQKKGIKKMPDMTSNEFKEYVQSKSQNGYKEFTIITDIYNEIKFSGSNDKNLLKKLGDSYKNLRKKL